MRFLLQSARGWCLLSEQLRMTEAHVGQIAAGKISSPPLDWAALELGRGSLQKASPGPEQPVPAPLS